METDELMELARDACRAAADAGAQDADVLVMDTRDVSLEIEKNSVKSCDVEYDAGYSVRAFYKGGVGYARGSGLAPAAVSEAGGDAAALAREAEPDPDFAALPEPAETGRVDGLYDPAAAALEPARLIEWGLKCIEAARAVEPEIIVKCGAGAGTARYALVNSRGVAAADSTTFISMYVFAVARRGDEVGSFYEFTRARRLEDLAPPEEIARVAAERAAAFVGARKIESCKCPIVLGPLAAYDFVRGVVGAASAEEIQRGRSYLVGKRGAKIAAPTLTVTEDPLFDAGIMSSPFDGEGAPCRRRTLIDGGALTTYLHNSYTANKAGEENTAHATRGSYHSNVGIAPSNLSIRAGGSTEAELIADIKDGLYIYMASIPPNPVSGQISGTVDHGFRIRNGELAYPVRNVMIGGDAFEFLAALEAVSSDYREEKGNVMPSILVGGVQLSGGA